ncbi:MAG TPA: FkbM family methyltransferase [Vicinamibacterales bacterium]
MSSVGDGIKSDARSSREEADITPGEFDLRTLPSLLGKNDPVILEIGCNDGAHTLNFLRLFGDATIYAFEPDPRARARFAAAVQDPRVKLFDIAISDTDGEIDFHMSGGAPSPEVAAQLPAGWDLSGSIRKPTGHIEMFPWCTFDQQIKVQTLTLDTWCKNQGIAAIDFIWADVQGAEGDMVRGARHALGNTRFLYTEYSDRELYAGQLSLRSLLALLPDFTVLNRFSEDVLLENTRDR